MIIIIIVIIIINNIIIIQAHSTVSRNSTALFNDIVEASFHDAEKRCDSVCNVTSLA